ncbi:MAG: phosphate propanoyltransferase [Patescibacteria group bacterium]
MKTVQVPIEISARHIHLSREHLNLLFGNGYELTAFKKISQPGQSAANETLKVIGPKGEFSAVRVIAPTREHTQLEVSMTDCYTLGIEPRLAISGDIENSGGGVTLEGLEGRLELERGVIVAQRHLHLSAEQAKKFGLRHLDRVTIEVGGDRGIVFRNVIVRSRKGIDELSFMIDTDEANAAGVRQGSTGILLLDGIQKKS